MARFSKGPWRIVKRTDKPGHRPMADEPRSLIDSWPFLVSFGIVVGVLYVTRAWGWV